MNLVPASTSTRPYLIRALYEWCSDNGLTPYVAVRVNDSVHVPREYVKDGEIVLNVSMEATSSLKLGNDFIEFKARFAGVARDIMVPVSQVIAIYARENGQGMAFPMEAVPGGVSTTLADEAPSSSAPERVMTSPAKVAPQLTAVESKSSDPDEPPQPPRPPSGQARPSLKRVK